MKAQNSYPLHNKKTIKVKKTKITDKQLPNNMINHLRDLKCNRIEDYKKLCDLHGFSNSINKSGCQILLEKRYFKRLFAKTLFKRKKVAKNLAHWLTDFYTKRVFKEELQSEHLLRLFTVFETSKTPKILYEFLIHINKETDFLYSKTYILALNNIAKYSEYWVRPFAKWTAKTHNQERLFSSLLSHLFCKYPVPLFMEKVWFFENHDHHKIFIHLANGYNIRKSKHLPVSITKKAGHYFLQAPSNYDIKSALRFGQILALGGDATLAHTLKETRLSRNLNHNKFWLTVIQFFVNHPDLNRKHIGPIVDYIWSQKFEPQRVAVTRGVIEERSPLQPDFSIKGRSPKTLLRLVNEWHRRLRESKYCGNFAWARKDINSFVFKEGKKEKNSQSIWKIEELLNSKELMEEGKTMKHCVASYGYLCHKGETSIWSLSVLENNICSRQITIEVSIKDRVIRQARGKHNRLTTNKEKEVISRWALREGLSMGFI